MLHYTIASAMKFKVLLFDRKGNFTMWQCIIKDLLMHQGSDTTFEEEKLVEMKVS